MTRVRWIVGGLVGLAALVIAIETAISFVAAGVVVGVVAVVVLAGILGLGLYSLGRARRDVARELAALSAPTPAGELWKARRAQALELRKRGVEPDLAVLAEATAADEAERGFAGKYLVATTILVGLVGTFGGLMETLARMSPLLRGEMVKDGGAGVLALLAGPLAGLHVTFGSSVVAILVTLALALVQGDVTLHHERLLARLQERTRHVLIPELWPQAESAAERTAKALDELKALISSSTGRGAETTAATAAKIAEIARVEMSRLADTVGKTMATAVASTRDSLTGAAAATQQATAEAATQIGAAVDSAAAAARTAATASVAEVRQVVSGVADAIRATMQEAATEFVASATAHATTLREESARSRAAEAETLAGWIAESRRQHDETSEGLARAARALADAGSGVQSSVQANLERTLTATATTTDGAIAALAAAAERTVATLNETGAAAQANIDRAVSATTAAADRAVATVAATTERTAAALADATTAALGSWTELRTGIGNEWSASSQALASATGELRATASEIAPALAALAPQLGAVARVVALLAVRADDPEPANAVLDELVRLGEDVERVLTLVQPPSPSAPAADGDSAPIVTETAGDASAPNDTTPEVVAEKEAESEGENA